MKLDPHIALSETGFLFHAATGDSYSVNPTGNRILEWIKAGKGRDAILTELKSAYEVDPERIEEDLDDFLRYLVQLKIVADV